MSKVYISKSPDGYQWMLRRFDSGPFNKSEGPLFQTVEKAKYWAWTYGHEIIILTSDRGNRSCHKK